jgi:hypothetical protein
MIGIVIILLSLAMLIWGLLPPAIETQILPIYPSDLQLPQPAGLHWVDWLLI